MGIKLMEFGAYMRKGLIFTITSVWKHPFLVCLMYTFIHISKSYPSVFSLLLSASPVVVCTAVLLGMLLVSGQQNIPETEKEKRERYNAIAQKHGMLYDGNLDEQEQCVESYSKSKRDEVGKVGVESGLLVNKLAEIRIGGSVDDGGGAAALSKESSETWEETGEMDDSMQQEKSELSEERLGVGEGMVDHYAIISKVIGELLESESEPEKSEGEEDCSDSDSDSERENMDSPLQRHKDDDDDDDDDDASDPGSGAESSSPDASIHEIMPMLDELHPLLDEDTAQPVQMSGVASEAALTEQSPRSSISSSIESGEETDVEVKKDETKSVITWTEEDQKNLMDVGSSESERNQRLERILRRRKNMSMVPEINLIDFENSDFQLNIAPISTSTRNPFDDDYYSNDPGSAPSIMSQRRNPFDIPYDEYQDENREELRPPTQSRQPFLRRRDNFLARPSKFAPKGQERQPARFRPLFIPEHLVSEESSYSLFQGQSSGVNSRHEAESVDYLEEGWATPHQGIDQTSEYIGSCGAARSPGKNYSSSSSFSDAHPEHDSGLQSHDFVTDKRTLGESSGVNSGHEAESMSSADYLEEGWATPHQRMDQTSEYMGSRRAAVSPGKNYSSSSSFSDAHPEHDSGLQSHGFVTDKRTQGESSGVNSGHEAESMSSVDYLEGGWATPHQRMDQTSEYMGSCRAAVSPGKNYSSSSSFSDAHPEHDSGLQSHGFVTDKRTQGESSGVNSGHEAESMSSVDYLEEGWATPHQGRDQISEYIGSCGPAVSPGKNYSSSSSFSDAHLVLDSGLQSHCFVTDKRTQVESSGVNSGHEAESVSSVDNLDEGWATPHQRMDQTSEYMGSCRAAVSPGKNYSSSSSFSDAHLELDSGLQSHGFVTDKRTQGESPSPSSHCNDHASATPPSDDEGQLVESS